MRLSKQPAFFEGKFKVGRVGAMDEVDERLALPSVVTVLLERARGRRALVAERSKSTGV